MDKLDAMEAKLGEWVSARRAEGAEERELFFALSFWLRQIGDNELVKEAREIWGSKVAHDLRMKLLDLN